MSEFIDAKELETYFKNIANEFGDEYKSINLEELSEHDKKLLSVLAEYLTRTIIAIEMFPRVDAEPIKYGRWINGHDISGWSYKRCSKCHIMVEENFFGFDYDVKHCPNCETKMNGIE